MKRKLIVAITLFLGSGALLSLICIPLYTMNNIDSNIYIDVTEYNDLVIRNVINERYKNKEHNIVFENNNYYVVFKTMEKLKVVVNVI